MVLLYTKLNDFKYPMIFVSGDGQVELHSTGYFKIFFTVAFDFISYIPPPNPTFKYNPIVEWRQSP